MPANKFDEKVNTQGNVPQLIEIFTNSSCAKKQGAESLQAGLTKITTNVQGQKNVVNCTINTAIQPQNIHLVLKWDANAHTYSCTKV